MKAIRLIVMVVALTIVIPIDATSNIKTEYLYGKTWCEIDSILGTKLKSELFFDKEGLVLCCTMAENPKQTEPEWKLCKFNMSENNVTITKKANQETNYNIIKLSNDTLIIKAKGAEENIRMFRTQNSLNKDLLSSSNNTTLDYLTAKQWQIVNPPKYLAKWHRWYFAENKWFLVDY